MSGLIELHIKRLDDTKPYDVFYIRNQRKLFLAHIIDHDKESNLFQVVVYIPYQDYPLITHLTGDSAAFQAVTRPTPPPYVLVIASVSEDRTSVQAYNPARSG